MGHKVDAFNSGGSYWFSKVMGIFFIPMIKIVGVPLPQHFCSVNNLHFSHSNGI